MICYLVYAHLVYHGFINPSLVQYKRFTTAFWERGCDRIEVKQQRTANRSIDILLHVNITPQFAFIIVSELYLLKLSALRHLRSSPYFVIDNTAHPGT